MVYDDPLYVSYTYPAAAFGASTLTKKMRGPAGRRCRVADVAVLGTTLFAGTTPAFIQIGDAGSATRIMGSLSMGTLAAGATLARAGIETAIKAASGSYVDKDTEVLVNLNTAVGGSPAGAADVTITLAWF